MRFLIYFFLIFFLTSSNLIYSYYNDIFYNDVIDSLRFNLYKLENFYSYFPLNNNVSYLKVDYQSFKMEDYNDWSIKENVLPYFEYVSHNEDRFDILISYKRLADVLILNSSDSIYYKNSMNKLDFFWIIGNPKTKAGLLINILIGNGYFYSNYPYSAYDYDIPLIGGIKFGFVSRTTPTPNLGINFELYFDGAGDSISYIDETRNYIDGSVRGDFMPDVNFSLDYKTEKFFTMGFLKYYTYSRIQNTHFYYNETDVKPKTRVDQNTPSILSYGVYGSYYLREFNHYFLGLTFKKSKTQFYKPTEDNNFPTSHGDIIDSLYYKYSLFTFPLGLDYFYNKFKFYFKIEYSSVKFDVGSFVEDRNLFSSSFFPPEDNITYRYPIDIDFTKEKESGYKINFLSEFEVNKNITIYLPLGFIKAIKEGDLFSGDFLAYTKVTNFADQEMNLGLLYNTSSKAGDLYYFPTGYYNSTTDMFFVKPLYQKYFGLGFDGGVEKIRFTVMYKFYILNFTDNSFNANNIFIGLNYLFL